MGDHETIRQWLYLMALALGPTEAYSATRYSDPTRAIRPRHRAARHRTRSGDWPGQGACADSRRHSSIESPPGNGSPARHHRSATANSRYGGVDQRWSRCRAIVEQSPRTWKLCSRTKLHRLSMVLRQNPFPSKLAPAMYTKAT